MEENNNELKKVLAEIEENEKSHDNNDIRKNELGKRKKDSKFIFLIIIGIFVIILALLFYHYSQSFNAKPIIYLYPEEETEISVKLGNKESITCSYPKYIDGWRVFAKPNGDLKDLDTGKNLYALYYESENTIPFKVEKEGFVVKGENVAEFLEEKLAILGLTDREAEEFIVYWLPKLEANKYNYIRFASYEEIEANMPLNIEPKPDTVIRVLMTYKGLDKEIEVKEQELAQKERIGFVTVEWGGTEIK